MTGMPRDKGHAAEMAEAKRRTAGAPGNKGHGAGTPVDKWHETGVRRKEGNAAVGKPHEKLCPAAWKLRAKKPYAPIYTALFAAILMCIIFNMIHLLQAPDSGRRGVYAGGRRVGDISCETCGGKERTEYVSGKAERQEGQRDADGSRLSSMGEADRSEAGLEKVDYIGDRQGETSCPQDIRKGTMQPESGTSSKAATDSGFHESKPPGIGTGKENRQRLKQSLTGGSGDGGWTNSGGGFREDASSISVETAVKKKKHDVNPAGYHIYVDLDHMLMYVYKDGELIKTYEVSGGKANSPSPVGNWKIISKDTWGEGFGGAWLGFNVPWGLYGIHGTNEPWSVGKYNSSKGCIRMRNGDARELYRMIPYNTPVTIVYESMPFYPMRDGDVGSDVLAVERALKKLGYYNGGLDGIFGSSLKKAVMKFQEDYKLYKTGVVNNSTYEKIMELEKQYDSLE